MWFMPSFGRPEALRKLLEAPGGWPDEVFILVNEDDPELPRYRQVMDALVRKWRPGFPWHIYEVPAGSRFASAVQYAFASFPNDPFYGIIDDDYWPITPGWHEKMVAAAGPTGIAIANNKVNFPSLYTCRVMGGDLARAIGTIAPGKMSHNFSDDTWARFAEDFSLLRPLEDVIVEHRHHLFDKAVKKDETYERGSHDFDTDKRLMSEWLNSQERKDQVARVAKLLGGAVTIADYSKVRLAICIPIQNMSVDIAFHRSFHNTQGLFARKGMSPNVYEVAGGSHIGKARERALWLAMKDTRNTHFLWIDDDMGWDANLVTRLIAADHDFSACVGVKKQDAVSFCFNPLPDPQQFHPVTKFLRVRHVGFAFVLLKRCVIERMCEAYPELQYNTGNEPPEWSLFLDMLWKKEPGQLPERLSEDFSFCQRWLDVGGEIYIDPDAALIHAGRKEYTGVPRSAFMPAEVANAA